ncbi:MAG: hypothetical protein L3K17_09145, partial [Thermoplasmata archaeon]|nr:hypothetical protein [Thermoplasmata archaeon]
LAALGPLLWGRPYGDLLYGQDSTRMFLPFSFNDSPFVPYSYLYSSTFPVPDFAPTFYLNASLQLFGSFGAPPWVAQRLQIGLLSALAAGGLILLFRAIDNSRTDVRPTPNWVVGVCVFAYLYNPFTLSITYWHIEGWLPFLAFLPWVVTLAVRTAFTRSVQWWFGGIVVLLGSYLSPGAISSFAVPVALVLLWGIAAVWLQGGPWLTSLRLRVSRSVLLLCVGLGIEAWSFVPFLLLPNIAYTSANYVTPENLFAVYAQASGTWGPYPVATFTAFGWLTRTPSAYPWISWLPAIAAAAVVFPVVAVLGAERLKRSPGSLLVYAIGLSVLPFLIGGASPLTAFNASLLHVGGPFLVIVAGFYILGPAYLLLVVTGLYETLRGSPLADRDRATPRASPSLPTRQRLFHRPSFWVTIAIGLLLVVSASPFLVGNVYQTRGPNADAVALPPSFADLEEYFGTPPSGPNSYVLLLPMSAQDGVFVNLSGSQFLDTSDALASYIPYPVLEANTGPVAAALEEAFALGTPANLSGLLAAMHVGAVVVNPFVNATPATMNEAPSGAPIDWRAILSTLPSQLGAGTSVGKFEVYAVPDTIPLAWSPSTLVSLHTPTASEALAFVGSVRSGPPGWASALTGSVWIPELAPTPSWVLSPVPLLDGSATVSIPAGGNVSAVSDSGAWAALPCRSGACSLGSARFQWLGTNVSVTGPLEMSSTHPADYSGSSPNPAGDYCSARGGSGGLVSTSPATGPAFLRANLTLEDPAANNWVNVQLSNGSESLLLQFWQNGSVGPATISLSASYRGIPYAWHNTNLPGPVGAGQEIGLAMAWNSTTAYAAASSAGSSTSTQLAFGDAGSDSANPGFNPRATPPTPITLSSATDSVAWIGGGFCLSSTSVTQSPQLRYLIATSGSVPVPVTASDTTARVESNGDVMVSTTAATSNAGTRYAILGFPSNPLWTASASAGAAERALAGAPLDNIVAVTGGENGSVVTFHFRTAIELGLEASWVEVSVLLLAVVVASYRRRRRSPTPAQPNTPGSPRGETPSDPGR